MVASICGQSKKFVWGKNTNKEERRSPVRGCLLFPTYRVGKGSLLRRGKENGDMYAQATGGGGGAEMLTTCRKCQLYPN